MADLPGTRDPVARYRDLLREVAAGTVLAITVVAAWGMLAPATIPSGNPVVQTGPGLVFSAVVIGLIAFTMGWLGTIVVLERRRPDPFRWRESWIVMAVLAPAIVVGLIVANGAAVSLTAVYLFEGGDWLSLDIPAGVAQWVVAWLGAFGVVFVLELAVTGVVTTTRAMRKAGSIEYVTGHERHR